MSHEFLSLVGGTALLVYAMEQLSQSIQYLGGSKFRNWINAFVEHRVSGILLGIFLALLLSSSGAVTVMLVGLANARLLSLDQVFSVILGASIGSTLIVQLFAFKVSQYGLLLVGVGVLGTSFSRSNMVTHIAKALTYLGLLFFSMELVIQAGKGLEKNELFNFLINYFHTRPIVSLFISALFTAIIQSSAATIAFVMSLMVARHSSLAETIPWILGANLGTTATAFVASLRGGVLGRQAALGNLLCRVVGIVLVWPFGAEWVRLVQWLTPDLNRQIAHAHTLFNLFVAILFFPFIPWGVKVVRKLVSEDREQGPFVFHYLDPRSLNSPELALAQAQREILRLSDIVEKMVERCISLFRNRDQRALEELKEMDQEVDFLNKGIKLYLTRLSQKEMTPEQVQKEFELLLRTNDLENVGDIIDKNILELVRKNIKKGYMFSQEGWNEITMFHTMVVDCLRLSTAYFNSRDRALSAKLLVLNQTIEDSMIELTEQHVRRLHLGVKQSLDTTSVHLDLLGNLQRIATLSINFTRVRGLKN